MEGNLETIIDKKIDDIVNKNNLYHEGLVTKVNDYIIEASGLDDCFYFEKVYIGENQSIGFVDKIEESKVIISIVKLNGKIHIGDKITCTKEVLMTYFSEASLGMIIDPFGCDKTTGRTFNNCKKIMIETPNIPLMDRTSVNRPLETGIISIDLMYPIGRGQRQLIIGDKKTVKTQIVLDTIVNQAGKDMICIFAAIGKTKSEVKRIYTKLVEKGASRYTIMVVSFNDDPTPLVKLTPYVAASIAQEYMYAGKDVLLCIDDLKKHADACREIALMSGENSGREAYPSDIFYSHSRLLEKGGQYKNGASITILPIVETKGGDITDYISTNIISITDGQIVLSEKLFSKGQKPAINFGLSVSRLGSAVQKPEIRKTGSIVRRKLLSYLETADVYQLVNLDAMAPELREKTIEGKKLLETFKQAKYSPVSASELNDKFEFALSDKPISSILQMPTSGSSESKSSFLEPTPIHETKEESGELKVTMSLPTKAPEVKPTTELPVTKPITTKPPTTKAPTIKPVTYAVPTETKEPVPVIPVVKPPVTAPVTKPATTEAKPVTESKPTTEIPVAGLIINESKPVANNTVTKPANTEPIIPIVSVPTIKPTTTAPIAPKPTPTIEKKPVEVNKTSEVPVTKPATTAPVTTAPPTTAPVTRPPMSEPTRPTDTPVLIPTTKPIPVTDSLYTTAPIKPTAPVTSPVQPTKPVENNINKPLFSITARPVTTEPVKPSTPATTVPIKVTEAPTTKPVVTKEPEVTKKEEKETVIPLVSTDATKKPVSAAPVTKEPEKTVVPITKPATTVPVTRAPITEPTRPTDIPVLIPTTKPIPVTASLYSKAPIRPTNPVTSPVQPTKPAITLPVTKQVTTEPVKPSTPVTTKPVTTEAPKPSVPVTKPVTTEPVKPSAPVTTKPVTTEAPKISVPVTKPVTTAPVTKPVTSPVPVTAKPTTSPVPVVTTSIKPTEVPTNRPVTKPLPVTAAPVNKLATSPIPVTAKPTTGIIK